MSENDASRPQGQSRAFAFGLVAIVMMLILPVPPMMLDLFLGVSIMVSLLVFLLAISFDKPVEFSTFPSVLLIATLLRLSLNIASTRLILLRGSEGPDAAGSVIQAFGQFVVGGSYLVGIIVFLILVIINFKVLTNGAGRIAEVAARFTLDAMPGKQMAIDNELANGHINEREAKRRRREVAEEADFYGAMDGANKFVKGDAVAGLIITAINLIGGILIGVAQNDMSAADAAKTYTILTIGDGLVSQVPALLVSTAAGLIATRSASRDDMGSMLKSQMFGRKEPVFVAGVSLLGLALVPGMPTFAFLTLGAGGLWYSRRLPSREEAIEQKKQQEQSENSDNKDSTNKEPPIHDLMAVDLLALEVGFDLVPLVDRQRGGELIKRITQIRKQIAQELGVVVPPMRVRDNLQLSSNEYQLLVSGTRVGHGQLRVQKLLAIEPGDMPASSIPGEAAKDPAFGLPARWIGPGDRDRAELLGFTVVDPATVAATHITELLKSRAADFLGRAEAQELIDHFAERNPKLVEEVIPNVLPLGEVIKVLKRLLQEAVSIRDLRSILEAIADYGGDIKDIPALTELVRQSMAKTLTERYIDDQGAVHALMIDPKIEAALRTTQNAGNSNQIDPGLISKIVAGLEKAIVSIAGSPFEPLLITTADLRPTVASLVARHAPGLAVLSFQEIETRATVKKAGMVSLDS